MEQIKDNELKYLKELSNSNWLIDLNVHWTVGNTLSYIAQYRDK